MCVSNHRYGGVWWIEREMGVGTVRTTAAAAAAKYAMKFDFN